MAENDGEPNTKVTIRDITLDDTSVSTTCDVNAVGPTVGSIGGVGTMERVLTMEIVLTTSDNKNVATLLWPSVGVKPNTWKS
jgi:hypothetical protein